MPRLKALRNRIASVKATQKITKAMQMVAASKLRRAQAAAEAARPYAERMSAVLGQSRRRRCRRSADAPRLLAGTGSGPDASAPRLHRRARPLRRLQLVDRAARPRPCQPAAWREGKDVKILCVGQKGYDVLRRLFAQADPRRDRAARASSRSPSPTPKRSASACWRCSTTASSTSATLFYAEFQSVISQVPTARQLIPAEIRRGAEARRRRRAATSTSRTRRRSSPSSCRATCRSRSSARCSRTPPRRGRQDDADGQRDAQRRRHDRPLDAALQPQPPGADHQGTDRDHLGRRGALRPEYRKDNDHGERDHRPTSKASSGASPR